MFNFTTETIINSAYDSNGTLAKYSNVTNNTGEAVLKITRVNDFLASKIKDGYVYKTAYAAPVLETATFTIGSAANSTVYRLVVKMNLVGVANAEYSRFYVNQGKNFVFEYKSDASATVTEIADGLEAMIEKEFAQYGYTYFTFANTAGAVTITAANEYQRFIEVGLYTVTYSNGSETATLLVGDTRTGTATGTASVPATAGKEGFGNTTWMIKNLRLPTLDATRYFGVNQEERPVVGGQYTQYSFEYVKDRDVRGLMAVGQNVTSTTTHVFYVLSTLVSGFETALTTAGLTILPNKGFILVTSDPTNPTLDISNGDTCTVSFIGNPNGAITYTSGTAGVATINSSTGVVTLVGAGTTVITGTDTQSQTATITLTVQA